MERREGVISAEVVKDQQQWGPFTSRRQITGREGPYVTLLDCMHLHHQPNWLPHSTKEQVIGQLHSLLKEFEEDNVLHMTTTIRWESLVCAIGTQQAAPHQ